MLGKGIQRDLERSRPKPRSPRIVRAARSPVSPVFCHPCVSVRLFLSLCLLENKGSGEQLVSTGLCAQRNREAWSPGALSPGGFSTGKCQGTGALGRESIIKTAIEAGVGLYGGRQGCRGAGWAGIPHCPLAAGWGTVRGREGRHGAEGTVHAEPTSRLLHVYFQDCRTQQNSVGKRLR